MSTTTTTITYYGESWLVERVTSFATLTETTHYVKIHAQPTALMAWHVLVQATTKAVFNGNITLSQLRYVEKTLLRLWEQERYSPSADYPFGLADTARGIASFLTLQEGGLA